MEALAFATQIMGALPAFIEAGIEVKDLVTNANTALANAQASGTGKISDADWDASNKLLSDLQSKLHS